MAAPTSSTSPFLLIFRDPAPEQYRAMSAEQRQDMIARWGRWYASLESAGKLKDGHPLKPVGRIIAQEGERITDGPFAEAKEAVGGFFFVHVADTDEAVAIAKQCPGLPYGITVEVRPVASKCPVSDANSEACAELIERPAHAGLR